MAVTLALVLSYLWMGDVYVGVLVAEYRANAALTASSLASTLSSALNERLAQLLEKQQKGRLDDESEGFIREIVEGAGRLKMLLRDVQLFLAEDRVPLGGVVVSAADALKAALTALKRRIAEAGATVTVAELPEGQGDGRVQVGG